jgi:transposase
MHFSILVKVDSKHARRSEEAISDVQLCDLEQRVPADHPLRGIRVMVDRAPERLSPEFDQLYSAMGRPSKAPKRLLRALLLPVLYSVRSERQLIEQLNYNLLFHCFAGLWAWRWTMRSGM